MPISPRAPWACVFACAAVMGPAPVAGAGELFVHGDLSISWGHGESGGSTEGLGFAPNGDDVDSSPVGGGAFGLAFPMNETLPPAWDVPLPDWEVRVELEGLYGRDYELVTEGGGATGPFLTNGKTWSLMTNLWLDLPVYEPVSWLFGRLPLLEPMSLFVGSGIGLATTSVDVSNNALYGKETAYNFAWQAGAGLSYALTEQTSVSLGYRYVDLGELNLTLHDGINPRGNFELDLFAHELRAGLRVEFYSVPFPGAHGGSRFRAR